MGRVPDNISRLMGAEADLFESLADIEMCDDSQLLARITDAQRHAERYGSAAVCHILDRAVKTCSAGDFGSTRQLLRQMTVALLAASDDLELIPDFTADEGEE